MIDLLDIPVFPEGSVKKVYCDLDGVLADLEGYARTNWGVEVRLGSRGCISREDFWRNMRRDYASGIRVFRNLAFTQHAVQIWTQALRWDDKPEILTVGAMGDLQDWVASDKVDWIFENLGSYDAWIIDSSLRKVDRAGPGVLLIDDSALVCARFRDAGGMAWHITGN